MRLIGLTGGIATGKSTVAQILKRLGVPVIDADALAHEVTAAGSPAVAAIAAELGPQFVRADGALDRPRLAERVFADHALLERLNAIVHPRVRALMAQRVEELHAAGAPIVVLDVPLLLESRAAYDVDAVWLVYAPEPLQIERLMARNGLSRAQAELRIRAQMAIEEKRRLADVVIDNSRDIGALETQVEALYKALSAS
jgi:dephospho-CoA kinase